LGQLTDLLEVCRSAGLAVTLEIAGEPRELSPGADLTAYRIIQEALTNATKYAASATASLCLRYSSTKLTITVTNDVRPGNESGRGDHGYGIIGMRERAQAIGGDLRVSDSTDVGFQVITTLPLHPRVSTPRVTPQVTP
jgi:signal transduction histidine kinase